MSFTIATPMQRTPSWDAARCGKATGSRARAVVARVRYGEARTRAAYRQQLVGERVTRAVYQDSYVSAAMHRGLLQEPAARAAYEQATGQAVRRTGFLQHTTLAAGCSVDGDLDNFDGILEIKNPNTATHLRYRHEGRLPAAHVAQVTHNLWLTGAAWCDFVSHDERCAPALRLFVVRVAAGELDLVGYARKVTTFLGEVDAAVLAFEALVGGAAAPPRAPRVFVGTHSVAWDEPGVRLAQARCGRFVDRTREHAAAPSCAACAQALAEEEALDV